MCPSPSTRFPRRASSLTPCTRSESLTDDASTQSDSDAVVHDDEPAMAEVDVEDDGRGAELGEPPARRAWHRLHLWQITAVRDVFWIALAVFLIWFGYHLRAIFTPVLIALALAYVFHPLITWADRRTGWGRPAVISVMLGVAVIVGGAISIWVGATFVDQTVQLASRADSYIKVMNKTATEYDIPLGDLPTQIKSWSDEVLADRAAYLIKVAAQLFAGAGKIAGGVSQFLGTTTYVLMTMFLIPVYFFFFAWQFGPLTAGFKRYIPASQRDRTLAIIARMDTAVSTFFRDRLFIGLIMGVMFSIGWWICGVPYWFLLGMGAGLLSLVPFLCGVMWPLAIALKWLDMTTGAEAAGFDVWAIMVWPTVVYGLVQMVEGWVLTPWIQGKSLEMSVVTVIIVVFIGGAVGGMYGLLLCIPVAACIKILMYEIFLPRLRTWAAEN
ncbi:MAG: AI-2E family transporter [Phycisphaera sp.]|nr:AI-2E family transporter [Phycisphaera sp.]